MDWGACNVNDAPVMDQKDAFEGVIPIGVSVYCTLLQWCYPRVWTVGSSDLYGDRRGLLGIGQVGLVGQIGLHLVDLH